MAAWKCHLLQSSERYENWRKILGSDEAPIISPNPIKGIFGAEVVDIFRLNIAKLSADQRERLIDFIVEKFGAPRATAQAELETTVCLRLAGAFAKFQTAPLHRSLTLFWRRIKEFTIAD